MNFRDYMSAIALDCAGKDCEKKDKQAVLDAVNERAAEYAEADLSMRGARAVYSWVELDKDDLGEGESLADAFNDALLLAADADGDGEMSEDEQDELDAVSEAAVDFLRSKGVTDGDIDALFDGDDEAANRVRDLLVDELPDSDGMDDDINSFAFSDEENEAVMDGINDVKRRAHVDAQGHKHVARAFKVSKATRMKLSRAAKRNKGQNIRNLRVGKRKGMRTRKRFAAFYKRNRRR